MKARNKDGTRTLEWLNARKQYLEENSSSVQWYIKLRKQTPQFRSDLVKKYNEYLKNVIKSDAYETFQEVKKAYLTHDKNRFSEFVEVARQKLISGDFQKAPAMYDPSTIEYEFFVKQYLEVTDEIEKQHGGFTKMFEEGLL